jgi:hypothetical protein
MFSPLKGDNYIPMRRLEDSNCQLNFNNLMIRIIEPSEKERASEYKPSKGECSPMSPCFYSSSEFIEFEIDET